MLDDYEWKPERQEHVNRTTGERATSDVAAELGRLRKAGMIAEKSARLDAIHKLFEDVPTKAEQSAILSYLADIHGLWP